MSCAVKNKTALSQRRFASSLAMATRQNLLLYAQGDGKLLQSFVHMPEGLTA